MKVLIALSFLLSFSSFAKSLGISAEDLKELKEEYIRPTKVPYPDHNPYSLAKHDLGKKLYFDPRLSGSNFISCATCHNPGLGWEDGMKLGTGDRMKKLGRHSPTIVNMAWQEIFMWDGRKATLEDQALGPIESKGEMNMSLGDIVEKFSKIKGYVKLFKKVFPKTGITTGNFAKAIATFERSVVTEKAPFDEWIEGNEKAISYDAKMGFVLFNNKANCAACHSGWRFTDDSFHDIGLKSSDIGRYKFIKGTIKMKHAFKTPGLRNINRRMPFMHDGSISNLKMVIDHYNKDFISRKSLSDDISKLKLTAKESAQLLAFLNTLTGSVKPVHIPELPY